MSNSPYNLTTEIFCLPHLGQYVVYAPLKGLLLLVNAAGADLLGRLAQGTFEGADEENLSMLSTLMDLEVLDGVAEEIHDDGDGEFRPTETTLFPTTACNLRCLYCYAFGGDAPRTMDWLVAQAAIDFVASNARAVEVGRFGVGFHGGGEPTLAWGLLGQCVDYARGVADREKLECHISLATNGVLDAGQVDWIAANVDDLVVSVDGLPPVQDRLRPLRQGGGSSQRVFAVLDRLSQARVCFGLRMTVTGESVAGVPEAVRFLCEEMRPSTIHLEPVFQCGRCSVEKLGGPSADEFIAAFRAARPIAEGRGVRLYYSGARFPAVSAVFCQAAGKSFTVTTEGNVTACYEVSSPQDPRAATFFFGRYDRQAGRFVFDAERLDRLTRFTVHHVPFCQDCFCKFHCAGDCPAKRLSMFDGGVPEGVTDRCRITQELTRDQIIASLDAANPTMRIVRREHETAEERPSHE